MCETLFLVCVDFLLLLRLIIIVCGWRILRGLFESEMVIEALK